MKTVVLKFGGSSLKNKETREYAYQHILHQLYLGYKVVVIVSAMGRKKDPYATDTFLSLVSPTILPKEKDVLMSLGETLSSIVVTNELRDKKIKARFITNSELGVITDDEFNNANVLFVDTRFVNLALKENQVVVVPGFQGRTIYHTITTLGRGGSDLTAILLAKAIQAKEVVIYTDVDGVYDSDPKVNDQAKRYEKISFDTMLNLCKQGSKVMHDRSIEYARQHQISMYIRSTFSSDVGTLVYEGEDILCN